MNKQFLMKLGVILPVLLLFWSCSRDSNNDGSGEPNLEAVTYKNLHAPQLGGRGEPASGDFTKFNFSNNTIVTGDDWDIAFRGTTIIVNGGAEIGLEDEPERTGDAAVSIVNNTLDGVKNLPADSTFKQDAADTYAIPTGSGNSWYSYNMENHMITPVAGKIFVVRTHDGKYAKFEIISYYQDAPDPADLDPLTTPTEYYTFRYVYQPNGGGF